MAHQTYVETGQLSPFIGEGKLLFSMGDADRWGSRTVSTLRLGLSRLAEGLATER